MTGARLALLHGLPVLEWRRSAMFPQGGYHVPPPNPYGKTYLSDVFTYAPRAAIKAALQRYNEQ